MRKVSRRRGISIVATLQLFRRGRLSYGPGLCRFSYMNFGELLFPRTSVNKGNEAGPELLRPGPALLLPPHTRSRSSSENSLTSAST
jgi:hypothetical protein